MYPKKTRHKNPDLLKSYHEKYCLVTNRKGAEAHHIITVKSGGPDAEWNLMPLCRSAHTEVHKIGLTKFADKYGRVKSWLLAHGWEFEEFRQKWVQKPGDHLTFKCNGEVKL